MPSPTRGAPLDAYDAPSESPAPKPPAALEASLTVVEKLKEMEFHSRANLERLAELMLTVEDELKQKEFAGPLGEVYSAQDAFQTKLTASHRGLQSRVRPHDVITLAPHQRRSLPAFASHASARR